MIKRVKNASDFKIWREKKSGYLCPTSLHMDQLWCSDTVWWEKIHLAWIEKEKKLLQNVELIKSWSKSNSLRNAKEKKKDVFEWSVEVVVSVEEKVLCLLVPTKPNQRTCKSKSVQFRQKEKKKSTLYFACRCLDDCIFFQKTHD